MKTQKLGKTDIHISKIGLGCMGMSEFYGPADEAESLVTLEAAFDLGVNFFDTADVYGMGHNENLLAKFLQKKRDKIILATKCGIVRKAEDPQYRGINGSYQYIKNSCEASLVRLKIDTIDLYYLHRIDPNIAIEESMEALKDLQKEGKIRAIGLSEANVDTISRAVKIAPVSALQSEFSLWTRKPEEKILPLCKELGISFVPYSPLGRGFLTGAIKKTEQLAANDFRRINPRFQAENFDNNLKIVDKLTTIAQQHQCTLAQLSLAWMLNKYENIAPIPGTKKVHYLKENVGSQQVILTQQEIQTIENLVRTDDIKGERYSPDVMRSYNME